MYWRRPTGFEDPDSAWEGETNALDGVESTYAICRDVPYGEYSSFLILTFPLSTTTKVKVLPSLGVGRGQVYICAMVDGLWKWCKTLSVKDPPEAVYWELAELPVTGIRLQIMPFEEGVVDARVHLCALLVPCPGLLSPLCGVFHAIGDFFADLADRIDDIMFVGDALAAPFVSLAETFHDLGDMCCEVSAALQDILDALEGGITPESLLALIEDNWPGLYVFITDPVAYITEIVSDLIPDLPDWLDDPVAYITEIVLGILPDLPDWLTDPVAWLASMFEENFPLLYYLIVDPGGWLLYIVGEAFGLEPYEAQDWDFVLKALFEKYFPELYLLWRELQLWSGLYEREGAVGVMRELRNRFYRLAERALRFLWEGVWRTS